MTADELRALTAAATPGPWGWRGNDDGAVELTALHSGYQRVLTTVRSEPCIIYTEAEGLIVTDEACDDCRAEAAKVHDPFDGYRCPKEANLGTIWLQDLDAHVIRPANTWAVREVPYRSDVVAVEHPDAALIVWCRNHADALADLIDAARYIRTTGHGEKLTDMTTCRCGDPHPCPVLRTHDAIADLIDAARAVETAQFSSRPGDLMRAVMGLSDPLTALEAR